MIIRDNERVFTILVANSAYGRLGMNLSSRSSVTYVKRDKLGKHILKNNYKRHIPINDEVVEVIKRKQKCKDEIPVQTGNPIISMSRIKMFLSVFYLVCGKITCVTIQRYVTRVYANKVFARLVYG